MFVTQSKYHKDLDALLETNARISERVDQMQERSERQGDLTSAVVNRLAELEERVTALEAKKSRSRKKAEPKTETAEEAK